MTPKIFDLRDLDMGAAYDITQTCDDIRHGDVLLVADGVAVLDRAWPVMVAGASDVFHSLADGVTWADVALDMGAADKAARLLAGVTAAQRPVAALVAASVPWYAAEGVQS